MDNDYFNKFIDSINSLSPHQLNRLEHEIFMYQKVPRDEILSDEERLMLSHTFKKDLASCS